MKKAGNVSRENLLSLGTCYGKFTKTGKFRLHITALDYLAPYAKVLIMKCELPQLYCCKSDNESFSCFFFFSFGR